MGKAVVVYLGDILYNALVEYAQSKALTPSKAIVNILYEKLLREGEKDGEIR